MRIITRYTLFKCSSRNGEPLEVCTLSWVERRTRTWYTE